MGSRYLQAAFELSTDLLKKRSEVACRFKRNDTKVISNLSYKPGLKMRKILSFGSLVLLSLTAAGPAFAEPKPVAVCETTLKDRLGENSGYIRVGFSQLVQQLGRPEFIKYVDKAAAFSNKDLSNKYHAMLIEAFDAGRISPQRHIVFLNYTVPGVNGVAAAATAKCEYVINKGREDELKASFLDELSIAKFQPID